MGGSRAKGGGHDDVALRPTGAAGRGAGRRASGLRKSGSGREDEGNQAGRGDEADLARALLGWYAGAARDLPWRRTRDPYAVWLSEIMLQQTRVDTVVPYYARFLERFPDVFRLASAPLDEVLSLWSGLGYYRRARQLHLAAREVVERYGGRLPAEPEALRTLPGVGRYTAGAIASIAFGQRAPLVDGNVARVLARLRGIADDVASSAGARRVWEAASRLVPEDAPGDFNQALMELGATVCTPQKPGCSLCPWQRACVAAREGRTEELPVTARRRASPTLRFVAMVARRGERVLLARRPEGGLFGGLWEPPMLAFPSLEAASGALASLGARAPFEEVGRVVHVLTHRRFEVRIARPTSAALRLPPPPPPYEALAWQDEASGGIGISTLARKILAVSPRPSRA